MSVLITVVAALVAYFLGSFPTSFLIGKAVKGVDIREHGSGNAGATNVARVVGKWPGLVVLLVDIAKGWVSAGPLALWGQQAGVSLSPETAQAVFGLCAVCGHIWSPFLNFQGGKGVATSAGVLLGLSPALAAIAVAIWGATAAATRYVSVSSIAAVTAMPLVMAMAGRPMSWIIVSALLCVLVVAKHRTNLVRLLRGEEHRLIPNRREC